ncbi:uncharacterized protein LOC124914062 [Impatiens glandulifera]|uniref:uncharacterized protein LOC124914062 n=1 Tax=Impatiens glandulifera TaxID=253017 RepID=UPI001FB12766|nr:uncharacterized protein LOC124914062 [Impatiens glandulifera]
MGDSARGTKATQPHWRSGYEPSDTETEWHETPWLDRTRRNGELGFEGAAADMGSDQTGRISPLKLSRRLPAKFEQEVSPPPPLARPARTSSARRRHSRSPYKPNRDDNPDTTGFDLHKNVSALSPKPISISRQNSSPFMKSEVRRRPSPFKLMREDTKFGAEEGGVHSHLSGTSNIVQRSMSAPRPRLREQDQKMRNHRPDQNGGRNPSVGEINEMVANAKISRFPANQTPVYESSGSIYPNDIFFSRDYSALQTTMQKIVLPKSNTRLLNGKNRAVYQQTKVNNGGFNHPRQSNGKVSKSSSKRSDTSGVSSGSSRRFAANMSKHQTETWFSCIKKGSSCRTSKSPERKTEIDESSFIQKASVVETLRMLWADKHQPASLNGFTCHKNEAECLKQLALHQIFPHIMLKGPTGSGKKALTMALLREIYGDPASNISHELRHFHIQEIRTIEVAVPITSSAHHVELNVHLEPNASYALMALIKQISINSSVTPEISAVNSKADFKVLVLYDVDKASENIQHLIKWIMDCYTESCKLILCCEDDTSILSPVKNRCKVIKVDAPTTHEIMEVLAQIAKKENFELSTSFAAKIATKSKQNLRKAIMALEACKAHNYPFVEEQPIPMGWEEVLEEIASQILEDPSQNRLFFIRGMFQKLLVDFLHPRLILQKLVEQFLKRVDTSMKRDLYYWHAYYDKRLPVGTSALLKLEEFVAKFMSIYRKSSIKQP